MDVTYDDRPPVADPAPGSRAGEQAEDLDHRGDTTIPARVLGRIVEQLAGEVAHVGAASGGVLGVGARRDFHGNPSAECEVYGRSAVIRLDAGIDFPLPLAETLAALRDHLHARIPALTGLDVSRLDLDISWLRTAETVRRLQ